MEFLIFLSHLRTSFGNTFFQFSTYLGQDIPILAIICILYWAVRKDWAYQIGLSFFSSGLLLQNLKITFRIPRPWILNPDFQAVPSAVPAATGYSFPSGHSQSAASLFGNLALFSKHRLIKALFTFFFLLVGFSRMYLGCHTPLDVLVGLGLGLTSVAIVHILFRKLKNTPKENLLISGVLFLFSAFTAVYSFTLLNQEIISPANAADAIKSAGAGFGFSIGFYLERTFIRFSTDFPVSRKVFRCFAGLFLLLVLKLVLSYLFGEELLSEMLQYSFLVFFILVLYPLLFQKFKI